MRCSTRPRVDMQRDSPVKPGSSGLVGCLNHTVVLSCFEIAWLGFYFTKYMEKKQISDSLMQYLLSTSLVNTQPCCFKPCCFKLCVTVFHLSFISWISYKSHMYVQLHASPSCTHVCFSFCGDTKWKVTENLDVQDSCPADVPELG